MAPENVRPRRDSCGLEVRPDGILIMGPPADISHRGSEVVRVTSREGASGGRNNFSLSRQEFFGSRQVLSSLMMKKKKKQRRDSIGLVVREDGTISLEQLSRMNSLHSPSPSLSNGSICSPTNDSGGRELSSQASCNFRDSGHLNWRNSFQPTVRGRRDSFGLEVREDGTLSLERLIVNTRDEGETERLRHNRRLQTSPTRLDVPTSLPHEPGSRRCHSGPSHSIASENATSISGPRSSSTRGVGSRQQRRVMNPTSSNGSEVELLRERVQRLEAELASRGRLPTHSGADAPPAYEPRRGSSQRQAGNTARICR